MKSFFAIISILLLCMIHPAASDAFEMTGYVAAEGRYFFHDPLYPDQERHNASLAMQQEYYHEWKGGSSVTFTPFLRIDTADANRTHLDVRELNYLWLAEHWELRIGIGKVFWGVTEFVHLVDIINQTDLVEDIYGEEKLGQPMIQLTVPSNWGVMELFILPFFRERTFPGKRGRLRGPIPVDVDNPEYESSEKDRHVDYSLRYSNAVGPLDVGIYHFAGTGREPTRILRFDSIGRPIQIPLYEQIGQTGLDAQLVSGNWLLKLESYYRAGQGDRDYFAGTGGFEYAFINVASSGIDVGLIGEWAYDERGKETTNSFDNDLLVGSRIALNDAASTEILLGFGQDINSPGQIVQLESSRRIGETMKVTLEGFFVLESAPEEFIHFLRDDDFVRLQIFYYF